MTTAEKSGRLGEEFSRARWYRQGALDGRPLLLLAHGAGAGLGSPFLEGLVPQLLASGLAVVRFHFPYMQQREDGVGRPPPDRSARLVACWHAVLDEVRRWRRAGPLVLGGKSLGARMASMLLAEGAAQQARGAVYLGYPLHPAGRPEKQAERVAHLPRVRVPQLFVSGTRDALAEAASLAALVARLPAARLLALPGADHAFARRRRDELDGPLPDWPAEVARFAHSVCEGAEG